MKPLARVIIAAGWLAGMVLTILIPSVAAGIAVLAAMLGLAAAVLLYGERAWARLKASVKRAWARWQLRKAGSAVERA